MLRFGTAIKMAAPLAARNVPRMAANRVMSTFMFPTSSKRLECTQHTWMQQHASYLHRCQHHLAHENEKDGKGPPPGTTAETPPNKKESFFNFISSRFLKFLDRYQKLLENKFPGAMNVYRVFVIGFKDFSIETKDYLMIKRRVVMGSTKVTDLNRKEIDAYFRMPGEILRVGPTLLISALPFANYIVFPIAYYFPKKFLSSHFWSLQQKSQFAIEFHKHKLLNYRPLFRHIQLNVEDVWHKDLKVKLQDTLHQLGSGSHPSAQEILDLKKIFEKDRYSLKAIHGPHLNSLCRIHGIHLLYLKRRRLYDFAEQIRCRDSVLARDGIAELKPDELRTACFFRGLNAANLDSNELREYLEGWLAISQKLDSPANSLLLHLPMFLTYNNPNNWSLLKS